MHQNIPSLMSINKEHMPVAISVSKNKPSLCEAGVGAGTIRLLRYSLEQVLPLSEEPVLHPGGGEQRRISWHTIPPRLASTSGPDPEVRRSHQLTCHSLHFFFALRRDIMASLGKWPKPPTPANLPPHPNTPVCHYIYLEFPWADNLYATI